MALTFAAFIFNTSEFIPIGLLTDIAHTFQITEAHAGMLITVYAWVVALASLPLMMLASKMEFRKLMLMVVGLFIASQFLSAVSYSYSLLMLSRVGVACAHAIFWSIASPMAVRAAPEGKRAAALSLIVTGTSVAMIVGLPLGRTIGLMVGWRMTFFYIGVVALLVLLMLAVTLPKMPNRNTLALRDLPGLLEKPALMGLYIMTAIFVVGYYTAYSYIEPFLGQVAGLSDAWITWVLTAFGVVGILASVLFSRYYDRYPSAFMCFAVMGVAVFLLLLHVASFNLYAIIAVCVCWGLAATCYNLVFQAQIIRLEPESTAIVMSAYSGIFNFGIGGGALVGGIVCDQLSISYIGYVGGFIACIASVYFIKRVFPLLHNT